MLSADHKKRLSDTLLRFQNDSRNMIGYPGTHLVDFSPLVPFLDLFLNNIGDPYSSGSFRVNTHEFEREVIAWFKQILRAENTEIWGYVTSGGTEGNMYAMYLAREILPGGIVYYSEDTHYSVPKILRLVNARSIMIKSRSDGEIDYDDLAKNISLNPDAPPIIFANIGTTMRGAVDNLDKIKHILKEQDISQYYLHADAALSGMILPFVDDPQSFGFDSGIDSIAVSGHKMPGSPMPCGIVLARQAYVDRIAQKIEYIGTRDTTIAGSRNGLSPLFLWYEIKTLGIDGFRLLISECTAIADYALVQFTGHGIPAWRHKNSLTVVFPRQAESVLKKWQIATQGQEAHLITMPHVTRQSIDSFISELLANNEEAA